MPDPINQHYVPQFLLRHFADPTSEALFTFDKQTRKIFQTNPRNVAAERRFYDIEVETGLRVTIEPGLADLEEKAAAIFRRIVAAESLSSITVEERAIVSAFLAVQFTRTRQVRENIKHLNSQIGDWLREMGLDPDKVEGFAPLTEEAAQYLSMKLVDDSRLEMAPHFFEKTWFLVRNPTDKPFILSDNPVSLHNSQPASFYGNLGLTSKGIEIHFPLSPRLGLNLLCPSFREQLEQSSDLLARLRELRPDLLAPHIDKIQQAKAFAEAADTGVPLDLQSGHVLRENSLQVRSAERWLFSSQSDFGLAEEMLDKHPELSKGPRLSRS